MRQGIEACTLTGIPALHAEAFQEVADREKCMIASRAVGKYATDLILEGYSSKGFHNKAKSCNWGPMAGFVLTDARFTKAGGSDQGQVDQAAALGKAIAAGATAVDLFISDNRRRWLQNENLINVTGMSSDRVTCKASSPWGLMMEFTLLKERPPTAVMDMWKVCYQSSPTAKAMQPVKAVRDPMCTLAASNFLSATTGDYDLFAIYAQSNKYSPGGQDKRMVAHATLEKNIRAHADPGEDPHLGNITPRIKQIRDALNTAIQRRGYTGGNMVHHSDEGGRPFVDDIDLPVFAVVPGQSEAFGIESVEDLRQFISVSLGAAYAPMFNPGWMKQLVFHSNPAIARNIHAELTAKIAPRR
jgi:hypothetical protein